jgi:uncharacterized protein (TIGR02466 family)
MNGIMHRKIVLFRSDLFHKSNVGSDLQRSKIITDLYNLKNTSKEIDNSNTGCIRLFKPQLEIHWLYDEIYQLISKAIDFYDEEDIIFKSKRKDNIDITYWANINSKGSRNVFHSHKENNFSLIYYVQAEGTGALRFANHSNLLGDCNNTSPFVRDFEIFPKNGDLFLWPSYVPHEVETNMSNVDRINLAFNINLT